MLLNLIMIALLSCFINCSASDNQILPTGDIVECDDSVKISYDDLRIVNSKLIELNYEKQINIKLRHIISNDSVIIDNHIKLYTDLNKEHQKIIKQRNIAFGVGLIGLITAIIFIAK